MNTLSQANISQGKGLSGYQIVANGTVEDFLDSIFTLNGASHGDVLQYRIYLMSLVAHLKTGLCVGLLNPGQFSDYDGEKENPSSIVLGNSEQQIELQL